MGFEPDQVPSRVESMNEFTNRMRSTLEEAKAALSKSKDDMTRYYNQKWSAAPKYQPGDKVYLDASDIQTTRPSKKLFHKCLGPFPIEQQVGSNAYRLKHPVFNVVKLIAAEDDPIFGRHIPPPPLPEIIDGEEEWVIEEVLDSKMVNGKLRYLIKWKDFGIEHNSWEPWDNVHAPELIADFHRNHPGAPRRIRSIEFSSIPFRPIIVPRHHSLEGGVDVRGLSSSFSLRYVPPHRRLYSPLSP